VATGLIPLLPFFLWRGVFSQRLRILAALLLALWPNQIIFSGVLAQDNWVLLPAVALVCLAVRAMAVKGSAFPLAAAALFALSVYIRQEMLVALVPAAVIAGMGLKWDWRRIALGLGTAAALLALIAVQRGLATGRYALNTEHGAYGILGSYIPGRTLNWQDPKAYLAATNPATLDGEYLSKFSSEYFSMTWVEIARRPLFHLVRRGGSTLHSMVYMFHGNSSWSIGQDGTLPAAIKPSADSFRSIAAPLFTGYDLVVHGLFAAGLVLLYQRSRKEYLWFLLPLLITLVLKLGVHAVIAAQSRYLMLCMGLELLVVAMAIEVVLTKRITRQALIKLALIALVISTGMIAATEAARYYVNTQEELTQQNYQFNLLTKGSRVAFACRMEEGLLLSFYRDVATIRLLEDTPSMGDWARLECRTQNIPRSVDLLLNVQDTFSKGGLADAVVQFVYVNGELIYKHDIGADASSGWTEVPLGALHPDNDLTFAIELRMGNPIGNEAWGPTSTTSFVIEENP
jgi:hypothetical protein